ncbi:protein-arginine deiminase family protein [Streptomyces sp. DSM 44915]|uniref:Protein-arginine deiminase family protein n=1 Tax=Streptomyces chisholmiae TaxID=3075540 RepID=A0ABU2JZT2_9ACTN|nr:protein-arginine deiminase family protein [Streptomyces sp. DSM 44915]MDT0270049.1 protein-arginine deiminase family protein [Streptomyces sp. DSM 44915]
MPKKPLPSPLLFSPARRRATGGLLTAALLGTGLAVGVSAHGSSDPPDRPRLLADTDRDGRPTERDEAGKGEWHDGRGAIVLPNLDDDAGRCPTLDPDGERLTDDRLAACHDGADDAVAGAEDAADLAPLLLVGADTSPTARATLTLDEASTEHAGLFLRGTGPDGEPTHTPLPDDGELTGEQLVEGAEFALEVRDFVRDPERWDGFVDVTLTVTDRGETHRDRVRLKVAPLLLTHDLLPVERMLVSDNGTTPEQVERADYDPQAPVESRLPGEAEFRADLAAGLAEAGLDDRLLAYPTGGDHWLRDQFITGYAVAPGPDGEPRRLSVLLRSADVMPEGSSADFPLRDGGRPAFTLFRGADTAVIQEFTADRVGDDAHSMLWGSFSSTGNFLVTPPYRTETTDFPAGRVLYGSDGELAAPDPAFTGLLAAQGEQDPLAVDTSWLGVGHIDEFLSFVPVDNERGWAALVADPGWGWRLLTEVAEAGGGDQPLVRDVDPELTPYPGLTVAAALEHPQLRAGTELATAGVDAALAVLTEELTLTEEDIVRVPALFERLEIPDYPRQDIVANHLPAVANGVQPGAEVFLAPDPHAPLDPSGADVFQRATEESLARVGNRVAWVEDWEYGHGVGTVGGELHCVTNAFRDLSAVEPWWREEG